MKKLVILTLFISPLLLGRYKYHKACKSIAHKMQDKNWGGDLDIEIELTKFDFNISCMESPSLVDYYKAGLK
jgi:hypothetical protein